MAFIQLTPNKTYATIDNAHKAVEKKYSFEQLQNHGGLRYIIMTHTDGRFFPVFIGVMALQAGVHFNFHVLA